MIRSLPSADSRRLPELRSLLVVAGLATGLGLRSELGGADPASSPAAGLAFGGALLVVAVAAGVRAGRPTGQALAAGTAGGAVLVLVSLAARGVVGVHLAAPPPQLLQWSALVALIACAEEALLRGALWDAVAARAGAASALGLTTTAFALMHLPIYGPGALPLDLAAGLWFGGLRLLTRGVAAPAVAHTVADLAAGWLG